MGPSPGQLGGERSDQGLQTVFVDEIRIYARAGHGGKGCVAFERQKYRPKGGPSGGNGGRGGEVILEADHDLNNLIAQYYQPRLLAQDGRMGLGKGMDGHAGKDLTIKVPCGTLVWRPRPAEDSPEPGEAKAVAAPSGLPIASSYRPLLPTAGREQPLPADEPERAPAAGGATSLGQARARSTISTAARFSPASPHIRTRSAPLGGSVACTPSTGGGEMSAAAWASRSGHRMRATASAMNP